MFKCSKCGSVAINPGCHGREPGVDEDLCDVCYWRKKAEYMPLPDSTGSALVNIVNTITEPTDQQYIIVGKISWSYLKWLAEGYERWHGL